MIRQCITPVMRNLVTLPTQCHNPVTSALLHNMNITKHFSTVCGFNNYTLLRTSHPWSCVRHDDITPQQNVCQFFTKPEAFKPPAKHAQFGDLVYEGTLARFVRFVKMFSLSTSVFGLAIQPFLFEQVADKHWAVALTMGGVGCFFIFLTPVLLHLVTKRYVTSLYLRRDTGVFTASTYTLFLNPRHHTFEPCDVIVPRVPGMFTTLKVKGNTPLFLDVNLFLDKSALVQLLRYDEPLEWEIPVSERTAEVEKKDKSEGVRSQVERTVEVEKKQKENI